MVVKFSPIVRFIGRTIEDSTRQFQNWRWNGISNVGQYPPHMEAAYFYTCTVSSGGGGGVFRGRGSYC